MLSQPLFERTFGTRYFQPLFLAHLFEIGGLHLIQNIIGKIVLRRCRLFLFGLLHLRILLQFQCLQGVIRYFFVRYLELAFFGTFFLALCIFGSTEQERGKLCRAGWVECQPVRADHFGRPLSEVVGMLIAVLARLHFHRGQVILCVDANPAAFHVRQHATEFSHVVPVVCIEIGSLRDPLLFLQFANQNFMQIPRAFGIDRRILDEFFAMRRVALHHFDGRYVTYSPL
mmetsp:Transcript_20609/g.58596  ORF Transcript_20609/g.58596 Transcript_20609/m.58596 type:complete len:229 (+) Transcript_20609:115-801(+)